MKMAVFAVNGCGQIGRRTVAGMLQRGMKLQLINDPAFANGDTVETARLRRHIIRGAKDRSERETLRERLVSGTGCLIWSGEVARVVTVSAEKDPRRLAGDYASLKRDDPSLIVADCSRFAAENEAFARAHLEAGAVRVAMSMPAKHTKKVFVHGANAPGEEDQFIPCGSCTTNDLALPLSVVDGYFRIKRGFMLTVHAVTTEQFIYDVANNDERKGRSLFNIIPTTTGAARALERVLPDLEGKMDGFALRIPLPNGSIAMMVLDTERAPSTEELRDVLREAATGKLTGVMGYAGKGSHENGEVVLEDILIDHADVASVVDEKFTLSFMGLSIVTAWYDNTDGFNANWLNLLKDVARLRVPNTQSFAAQ